jgi:hydroxyacylglutathione hydrolase
MFMQTFIGGSVATNCYIIPTLNNQLILIDAPEGVANWLEKKNLKPTHLLLTHQHFDHVMDVAALKKIGAKVFAYEKSSDNLTLTATVKMFGIQVPSYTVDELLIPETTITIDNFNFDLAHVPGHSTDSITFYSAETNQLFSGDTLFQGSIGRTDLQGGNHSQLIDGINKKLLILPKKTKVYPGHGDSTTIEKEISHNPHIL